MKEQFERITFDLELIALLEADEKSLKIVFVAVKLFPLALIPKPLKVTSDNDREPFKSKPIPE